ncbi:MAG TPA: hypothetical protein VGP46_04280, partial [Acidimicrobiales bacterium]|nr:hypothetical protein [Acidimicrobiales bacterium]
GYFGNPSNSDFGEISLFPNQPQNCFDGNVAPQGSAPPNLEKIQAKCGPLTSDSQTGGKLLGQVLCDTGFGSCPAGAKYPMSKSVVLTKVPDLPTMPNPCDGVPTNPWCPGKDPGYSLRAQAPGHPGLPHGASAVAAAPSVGCWRRMTA